MGRYPVFIVGSPRSGTSALVDALEGAGYHGFREGLFLSLIHPLHRIIDHHYAAFASTRKRNMISSIDKDALKQRIFAVLKAMTVEKNPLPPWFDKTGNADMIQVIPTLLELWPESIFIMAKRRAIENIISRQTKFPSRAFEEHCIGWTKNMHAWRLARRGLRVDQYIEVDQQDMLRTPAEVAERLARFLGVDPGAEAPIAQRLRDGRPQETEPGSASRVYSLASSGWNGHQVHLFLSHCKVEMTAYGYTMDVDYAAPPGRDAEAESANEAASGC